jgi:glyoxylase-like metal-dependent hydrolase (beta-lactamase superfamily II)
MRIGNVCLTRISSAIVLCMLSVPATTRSQQPPDAGDVAVTVTRLSDRVAVFRTSAGSEPTNAIAIRSQKGIVVVDTERSPTFAAAIRRAIENEFSGEIAYLIDTHGHADHTYGNQVFADATIIAHENAPADIEAAAERREGLVRQLRAGIAGATRRYESLEQDSEAAVGLAQTISYYEQWANGLESGFVLTLPDSTFSDTMSLDLGDLTLELVWFGNAHTNGDILIYCPEEQLLLVGDLFYSGGFPYIDSERVPYLPRWHATLDRLLQRKEGITHVVTGHELSLPLSRLDSTRTFIAEQQTRFAGRGSALDVFRGLYEAQGTEVALERLREMNGQPDRYYVLHPEFDTYAYRLMLADELDDARAMFLVLAELFPESDVAFDSLGEVYMRLGDNEAAIASFEKALELNPENGNAAEKLRELKG